MSLGGGGTDLPSYYREHGGFLVGGAIDKYVYMLTHTVFQRRYRMKYSQFEEVDEPVGDPPPDPARGAPAPLERRPARDQRGRRRPGRDGARLVRRVHRLPAEGARARTARRRSPRAGSPRPPARSRSTSSASRPGKQDQYVAAHGGICAYTFNRDGTVDVEPLALAAPDARAAPRQPPPLLHRRGALGVGDPRRPGRAHGDAATTGCSRTSTGRRRWASRSERCSSAATSRSTPS